MTDHVLDTSGLRCPMPLLKTKLQLNAMQPGEMLEVIATDPGSAQDIPSFLKHTSHSLEKSEESEGMYRFLIRCGESR
ncbi:sulfurtransferase TusA family protein [Marinobacter fonticola]|uniref:sulfurtransferase TusA family protein n=1 Tax=Marinobacter fonticola TaxID=2603215 RepID=UPI0011E61B2D|nr:sulfurtransferase TusA family protein [Marinobacter fonticola]